MNKRNFYRFNKKFNYIFIDESGKPDSAFFNKVIEDIKKYGYAKRENSTFTISGVFINSQKKYFYLKREINRLKKDILKIDVNQHVHKADIKSNKKFLNEHNITYEQSWLFQKEVNNLIQKYNLKIFSESYNREIIYSKPYFDLEYSLFREDILKKCIIGLLKNILNSLSKIDLNKKIILVFEETDPTTEKKIQNIFDDFIKKEPSYNIFFKEIMFMGKYDKNNKPVLGNEIIDFINYGLFQWSSNIDYHQTKFGFYNYPYHETNSVSLIDSVDKDATNMHFLSEVTPIIDLGIIEREMIPNSNLKKALLFIVNEKNPLLDLQEINATIIKKENYSCINLKPKSDSKKYYGKSLKILFKISN